MICTLFSKYLKNGGAIRVKFLLGHPVKYNAVIRNFRNSSSHKVVSYKIIFLIHSTKYDSLSLEFVAHILKPLLAK